MTGSMSREGLALEIFNRLANAGDGPVSKAADFETRKHATLNLLEDVLRVVDGKNRPDQTPTTSA